MIEPPAKLPEQLTVEVFGEVTVIPLEASSHAEQLIVDDPKVRVGVYIVVYERNVAQSIV